MGNEKARFADFFLFRLGDDRCKVFFHWFEGRRLCDRLRPRLQEHNLAFRLNHPLIERRMCSEPTNAIDVALLCRHFVEETDETTRIVAGIPSVLDSELI